jgi:hypothetical protein
MDDETKSTLKAMEARIMARFEQTDERIHDVETKLLRAFVGWGRAKDAKLRSPAAARRAALGF